MINACKNHWEKDIRHKFLQGGKAYPGIPCFWEDGTIVKSMWKDCPMCHEYLLKDYNCGRCLFKILLNTDCGKAGGFQFALNPCLKTCNIFMSNFDKMLEM